MHYRDANTGAIMKGKSALTQDGSISGVMTGDLPDGATQFPLQFVVDYVYPIGPLIDYAYDPDLNDVTTTAGFGGPAWSIAGPQVTPGQAFPVASTEPVLMTCQ